MQYALKWVTHDGLAPFALHGYGERTRSPRYTSLSLSAIDWTMTGRERRRPAALQLCAVGIHAATQMSIMSYANPGLADCLWIAAYDDNCPIVHNERKASRLHVKLATTRMRLLRPAKIDIERLCYIANRMLPPRVKPPRFEGGSGPSLGDALAEEKAVQQWLLHDCPEYRTRKFWSRGHASLRIEEDDDAFPLVQTNAYMTYILSLAIFDGYAREEGASCILPPAKGKSYVTLDDIRAQRHRVLAQHQEMFRRNPKGYHYYADEDTSPEVFILQP